MEERDGCREPEQRLVREKKRQGFGRMVASLLFAAGDVVVDGLGIDPVNREDTGEGERSHDPENGGLRDKYPARPAMIAVTTLPAWFQASLRPTRFVNPLRPTMPRLMAVTASGKMASAIPFKPCANATGQNVG